MNRGIRKLTRKKPAPKKQKTKHDFSALFQQETKLDDLAPEVESQGIDLVISDPTKYFDHQINSESKQEQYRMDIDIDVSQLNNLSEITFGSLQSNRIIHALSKNVKQSPDNEEVSTRVLQECKQLVASSDELLRHFWASLLVPARLEGIVKSLEKVRNQMKNVMLDFSGIERTQVEGVLVALKYAVDAALSKYQTLKS